MIITLNHKAPLGLPSGVKLQPLVPTHVPHWESDMKSALVRAWVKSGALKVGDAQPSKFVSDLVPEAPAQEVAQVETESIPAATDKESLIAALEAKGIKADRRMGIKKLQELLAASE